MRRAVAGDVKFPTPARLSAVGSGSRAPAEVTMLYEPANEPVHRGIVIADIEGSCRPGRTNLTLVGMSDALRRMVEEGFRRASISERQVVLKGLGDGLLALLHSDVNKPRMIEPLVPHLVSQLQARNRKVGEQSWSERSTSDRCSCASSPIRILRPSVKPGRAG